LDAKDKIIVKIMTAKTYYEMGETEALLYNIDSAKHFLSKNKSVAEARKKSYVNFYNCLSKLVSLSENGNKVSARSFIGEIRNMDELNERMWILEKLKELSL